MEQTQKSIDYIQLNWGDILIPIEEIFADDEFNCRGGFDDTEVRSLAKDIAAHGLFTPITVRELLGPNGEKYTTVAGHRRLRACRLLKMTHIPAHVQTLSDREARSMNIRENLERKQLNLYQEAMALRFYQEQGMSPFATADMIGRSENWVKIRFAVLRLPPDLQEGCQKYLLPADIIPLANLPKAQQRKIGLLLIDKRAEGNNKITVKGLLPKSGSKKQPSIRVRHQKDIWTEMEMLRSRFRKIKHPLITPKGNSVITIALAWASGAATDDALTDAILEFEDFVADNATKVEF